MRRTLTALVPLLVLTAACASPLPTTTPSAPESTSAAPTSTPPMTAPGAPPRPDEATAQAYLADLRTIDPAIVDEDNTDKAISRGRSQCASVKEFPDDRAKLLDLTNKRFTAPGHGDGFGLDKAERILAAVRKHLCPTY